MHPRIGTFVTVLAVVLGGTLCFGQTTRSTFKPSAAYQKLGIMVGSWVAHGTLNSEAEQLSKANDTTTTPAGKFSSTETCAWTADRFGVICHSLEDIPGMGKIAVTDLVTYDSNSKNYLSLEVGASGTTLSRGNVEGNTWTWISTFPNETLRFTVRYISENSCQLTVEGGPNLQSLKTTMQATLRRVRPKSAPSTSADKRPKSGG